MHTNFSYFIGNGNVENRLKFNTQKIIRFEFEGNVGEKIRQNVQNISNFCWLTFETFGVDMRDCGRLDNNFSEEMMKKQKLLQ